MKKRELFFKGIKLLFATVLVGLGCGVAGTLFHKLLELASDIRSAYGWFIYLLPIGGLAVVLIYRLLNIDLGYGTVSIIKSVREDKKVPAKLAPSIFIGTFLTHLFGGSSGREGAALQLGGSLAGIINRIKFFGFGETLRRTVIMCGMCGLFSALFGTPLAAAVFVLSVVNVGKLYKIAVIPCVLSSFSAYGVAYAFGCTGVRYEIAFPAMDVVVFGKLCIIAVCAALISIAFCFVMENTPKIARKIKNEYVRVFVGAVFIVVLTLVVNSGDYNGTGSHIIQQAISGSAKPEAFILKLVFTALTLSFGFKGGEIVPSFFVGSTFGCTAGVLLGIDPGVAAAAGMMAVFCGVTNCPIASVIMAVEVFGIETLPMFIPVCALAYLFSGRHSLYGSRKLFFKDFLKPLISDIHK